MNDSQKTVLFLAGIAVVASIVFCPYVVTRGYGMYGSSSTSTEYGWIWDAPSNSTLDFARLAITWVAIVVGGAVWFAYVAGNGKK
jgi:hypothetical protein